MSDLPVGNGQLILLVEDDKMTRIALGEILEALSYRVLATASGREALAIFDRHGADIALVLSDWALPQGGGAELIRALQARQPEVKVMVLTGHRPPGGANEVQSAGAVGWLQKPVELEQLALGVAQALGQDRGGRAGVGE